MVGGEDREQLEKGSVMQSSVIPSQVLYGTAHVKGDVVPFLCST